MSCSRVNISSIAGLTLFALCATGCAAPSEGSSEKTGRTRSALIGGELDTADPAVVLVAMKATNGGGTCSGVVVSPHVIVTAAHCLDPRIAGADVQPYYVFLGTDLTSKADLALKANYVPIKEVHFDPDFNPGTQTHDVGVVITENELAMTPIQMNRQTLGDDSIGKPVRMVGYGIFDMGADANPNTQAAKHDVSINIASVDAEHMTYTDHTHAMCEGDSGGPSFIKRDDGTEVVVGIHSFVKGTCTAGTGYDTRIDVYAASYIDDFIKKSDPNFHIDVAPAPDAGGTDDAGATSSATTPASADNASSCSQTHSSTGAGIQGIVGLVISAMMLRRRRGVA